MQPNAQQIQNLKNYLRGVFKFRETYEEVFDHILTAIEHRQVEGRFEDAVNQIIAVDFGGANKLRDLEVAALNSSRKEGVAGYLRHFKNQLYGNRKILPMLMGLGCLVWLKLNPSALLTAQCILVLMMFCPRAVSVYRYFKMGYLFKDNKPSIKDVVYQHVAAAPFRLYVGVCLLSIVLFKSPFEAWALINAKTMALLTMLGVMYVQAYVSLFKEEFKLTAFNI